MTPTDQSDDLPEIPVVGPEAADAVGLLRRFGPDVDAILHHARRHYGGVALRLGDRLSRQWVDRRRPPYADEIAAVAREVGRPGGWLLNLSYEWACTTGIAPDPAGLGARMLRTLDWPLDGLGRHVVVARRQDPAGPWLNLTWPGAVRVITALATGRFAVALNQAPAPDRGLGRIGNWMMARLDAWASHDAPPPLALRAVVETARDYDEARRRLAETATCVPAIYSLAGTRPEQACVIERDRKSVV
jgi:hypothetical protein